MTTEKLTMVVLANSYKNQARCVAGIDLDSHQWIRPVSHNGQGELSEREASVMLPDGKRRLAVIGDVVEIELGERTNEVWHPEDRFLAGPMRLKTTMLTSQVAEKLRSDIRRGGTVLGDFEPRIAIEEVRTRSHLQSLQLLQVSELRCAWRQRSGAPRPQLRGFFTLAGKELDLSITDTAFNDAQRSIRAPFTIESPVLTISLSSPFTPPQSGKEYCYKLIAGVIPPAPQSL